MTILPKEVLDHLYHAGYMAVPKERLREFWVERTEDVAMLHLIRKEHVTSFEESRMRDLAFSMGMTLLKAGFIEFEVQTLNEEGQVRTRCCVYAVAPRVVRKEPL